MLGGLIIMVVLLVVIPPGIAMSGAAAAAALGWLVKDDVELQHRDSELLELNR